MKSRSLQWLCLFLLPSLPTYPSSTPITCKLVILMVSSISLRFSSFFFILSSLFFRLHNFYWSIFTDWFFHQLKSTVQPLWQIFHFRYCIFQLENFHLILFFRKKLYLVIAIINLNSRHYPLVLQTKFPTGP